MDARSRWPSSAAGTTVGTVVEIDPVWLHAIVAIVPIGLGLAAALLGYSALAARGRGSATGRGTAAGP